MILCKHSVCVSFSASIRRLIVSHVFVYRVHYNMTLVKFRLASWSICISGFSIYLY